MTGRSNPDRIRVSYDLFHVNRRQDKLGTCVEEAAIEQKPEGHKMRRSVLSIDGQRVCRLQKPIDELGFGCQVNSLESSSEPDQFCGLVGWRAKPG